MPPRINLESIADDPGEIEAGERKGQTEGGDTKGMRGEGTGMEQAS